MLSLVTGGAGFIGSHIAEALLARGERVRVLDNFSTGHRRDLGYAPAVGLRHTLAWYRTALAVTH